MTFKTLSCLENVFACSTRIEMNVRIVLSMALSIIISIIQVAQSARVELIMHDGHLLGLNFHRGLWKLCAHLARSELNVHDSTELRWRNYGI